MTGASTSRSSKALRILRPALWPTHKEVSAMDNSLKSRIHKSFIVLMGAVILTPFGRVPRVQAASRGDVLEQERAEKELNDVDVDEKEMDGGHRQNRGRHRGPLEREMEGDERHGRHR